VDTGEEATEKRRALSIRQPYAEQVLLGTKKIEYRKVPTNIRGRVYIYASQTPGRLREFQKLGVQPRELQIGVVVGTVEVVNCTGTPGAYKWHLKNPHRLAKALKPKNQPQPVWFYPF
jgi:hypothetical protein